MKKNIVIYLIFLGIMTVSSSGNHVQKNEGTTDRKEDGKIVVNQEDFQNALKLRVRRSDRNPDELLQGSSRNDTESWCQYETAHRDSRKDLAQVNAALIEIFRDRDATRGRLAARIEAQRREAEAQADKLLAAEMRRCAVAFSLSLQNAETMRRAEIRKAWEEQKKGQRAKMQDASEQQEEGQRAEMQDASEQQEEGHSAEMQDASEQQGEGQSAEMQDASEQQGEGQSAEMQDASEQQKEGHSAEMQDASELQKEGQRAEMQDAAEEQEEVEKAKRIKMEKQRELWRQLRERAQLHKKRSLKRRMKMINRTRE